MGLLLQAVDAAGPWRWRWLLTDADTGEPLADHEVDLDPASDEVAAFGDLYGYARSHAAPDRRTVSEKGIVERAGAWAGQALLGDSVGAAIAAAAPVTVRVSAPAPTDFVLWWPLELAHADGAPLAARGDVTLVYDIAPVPPGSGLAAAAGPLRMLAVFSQPTRTSVLALRRERYALSRLIRRIARQRRVVELQVVQYGVTRERLASIVDSGGGWDVLHLSGHGGLGVFLLEHADGSPDPVDTAGLMKLLRPARRRVRLAVVSACQSAADVTAETLRLIGLPDQAERVEEDADENGAAGAAGTAAPQAGPEIAAVTGLARALARELDCAVVGMRYPVIDDFAIAFAGDFYERLLSRAQPVDVAAARAVAEAAGPTPSAARPAMSVATPGVFGLRAAGLTLAAPRGAPRLDPAEAAMAYFPREPERFVGRAAAMAKASAALAPDSGRTAVLLHGMAGAGKTACALELAYRHQDAFAAVAFWQAPTRDDEFAGALPNLAIALETQLGDYGFAMTGHIGTVAALEAFLPRLRQVLEDSGILLVLDNLETLLTAEGTWRDPRWAPLISALTGHDGESRLVLTSRVPPAGPGPEVLILPVHALSLSEAIALARELPNLHGLLHADEGAVRSGAEAEAVATRDRERVRRVMHVVQGHPKLLELADAAAADTGRLDAQLEAAESAAAGQGLDAFFRKGTSTLDPEQFLAALSGWTGTALEALLPAARLMAEFLACLEDGDRQSDIIKANWAGLWRRLNRPGDPADPGPLLNALSTAALVHVEEPSAVDGASPSAGDQPSTYGMHPGVAAAIGAAAPAGVRESADAELAAFWATVAYQAQEHEAGEDSALIVHAGLAAAPYLLRRGDWDTASTLLENAINRDESPGVIAAALPALRRIAAATGTPKDDAILAGALSTVNPAEAERLLRGALDRAADSGENRLASGIAAQLINLLRDAGRLAEALGTAEQKAEFTRRAGLGPWTQLLDQGIRLQVLSLMGKHEQVLAVIAVLRDQMSQLPARPGDDDPVSPWNIRETMLDVGRSSALALGRWQQCLDLNAEILVSIRQRDAGVHEITRSRYNDADPLLQLRRWQEAGRLLAECQQVFEDYRDITALGAVLSTRANLEDELGHREAAADFERTALRLRYSRPVPRDIAVSHYNLAIYLGEAGDRAGQRAHRLAAALIHRLIGMTYALADTQRALAAEMRQDSGAVPLPATVADVIRVAEQTDGVRLGELLAALEPDAQAVEDALAEILRAAADLPPGEDAGIAGQLEQWEPVIAAVAAACGGDQDAAAELGPFLDDMTEDQDWAALGGVLRRILGGERGEELVDGLDPVDTAIVREVLERIGRGGQGGAVNPDRSG